MADQPYYLQFLRAVELPCGLTYQWRTDMDRAGQVDMCYEYLIDSRGLDEQEARENAKALGIEMARVDAEE